MPHTDSIYSRPVAVLSFFLRLLTWVFRELSVQSGVSREMRSKSWDFVTTPVGLRMSCRSMAYSVGVSLISPDRKSVV